MCNILILVLLLSYDRLNVYSFSSKKKELNSHLNSRPLSMITNGEKIIIIISCIFFFFVASLQQLLKSQKKKHFPQIHGACPPVVFT